MHRGITGVEGDERKTRRRIIGREKRNRRRRIFSVNGLSFQMKLVCCKHRHVIGLVGQVGNFSPFISHADEFGVSLEQAIGCLQKIEKLISIIVCLLCGCFS